MTRQSADVLRQRDEGSEPWMVHFVSGRNPRDRGFYHHLEGVPLPADFELSRDADEFEVLCRQIELGALIPGFPDGFDRYFSPQMTIVGETIETVEFSRRASMCGVMFMRGEFERAGAFNDVIPGRPDLRFNNLLAWNTRGSSAGWIEYRAPPSGSRLQTLGLPLLTARSPFSRIGVIVDDEEQADVVQTMLTWHFLGLRRYLPADRFTSQQFTSSFILSPAESSDPVHPPCSLRGLKAFAERPAVWPSRDRLRIKVRVNRAIQAAMHAVESYPYAYPSPPLEHPMYIGFAEGNDDMSVFLISTGWASFAEKGARPGDWRLEIDMEGWLCEVPHPWMFEVAASSLKASLGLDFYAGTYTDYQS